jgi:APA family basic amino acid/polyamine antiporter
VSEQPPPSPAHAKPFGLWSGVGLVVANMVGAGVFLSTGFMAQSLGPAHILLAWGLGAALALCGAVAYAEVARLVPRGGGEYRYVSTLLHPALGYLAGWASLLVGFSAPIALDALAAGAFARAVSDALEPRLVGAALIVGLTALHAFRLRVSSRAQNALVAVKVLLLAAFVGVALVKGTVAWPAWQPPQPGPTPWPDVVGSLFFIAFAFSGWNAAVYAADEFEAPARDVPRAMLVGALAVGALYLVVNYVFVANLTPAEGAVVFRYDDFTALKGQYELVTLGQAVMGALLGPTAARVMSGVMVLLFVSAMSAMMLVGPRVYAAMAADGFLPRALAARQGAPPAAAIVLQGALALGLLVTHDVRTVLANVGAVLVLFAGLTVAGLFRAAVTATTEATRPRPLSLLAAAVYVLSSAWMLVTGFSRSPALLGWIAAVAAVALVAYEVTRSRASARG